MWGLRGRYFSTKTPQISGVHLTRTTDSESALRCSKLKERTRKLYNPALVSAQFGSDSTSTAAKIRTQSDIS